MSDYATNIDEFLRDIKQVANEFPIEAEKRIQKIGNKFKKIIREKSPDSGKESKRKLKKSWKSKIEGYSGENLSCEIWSTSPHFHLQDRGHIQKDIKGNPKRFIPGKHFLEAAVQEVESTVAPQEYQKFIDDIAKKLENR